MNIKECTDIELIEEMKKRNLHFHLDYIQMTLSLNNIKVKTFAVKS